MEQNNSLTHLLSYRDPHFGLFWDVGLLLGYLAMCGAKFDIIACFLEHPVCALNVLAGRKKNVCEMVFETW